MREMLLRLWALALIACSACDSPRKCSQLWIDDEMWPHERVTILSAQGRVLRLRYERLHRCLPGEAEAGRGCTGEVTRPESYATRTADSWRCVDAR
jgi:hypothetical protein